MTQFYSRKMIFLGCSPRLTFIHTTITVQMIFSQKETLCPLVTIHSRTLLLLMLMNEQLLIKTSCVQSSHTSISAQGHLARHSPALSVMSPDKTIDSLTHLLGHHSQERLKAFSNTASTLAPRHPAFFC